MCGIAGYFCHEGGPDTKGLSLAHRGPDSHGAFVSGPIRLEHYRLAILGEESVAAQPMTSRDGQFVLVFNGEIYNYVELADWLGEPSLAEEGDTRVLLEFLARFGLERLEMLNGMFAFGLYDLEREELHLVRDRLGIKPLYWSKVQSGVGFASEIKTFEPWRELRMDPVMVDNYLDRGTYPSFEKTFYKDIHQVQAGCSMTFSRKAMTRQQYYSLKDDCLAWINRSPSVDEYEELLADSIRLRLRSDVPVSLHFSGGIDSTALLTKMKEEWSGRSPVVDFSMGFAEGEDESQLAGDISRMVGAEFHSVLLSAHEVPQLAEELSWYQDEPYGGVPTIAYYKFNKVQRDAGFIVGLEGQGGDETFGGYLSHVSMAVADLEESGASPDILNTVAAHYGQTVEELASVGRKLYANGFLGHTDLTDLREGFGHSPELFVDRLRTIALYDILENKIPRTLRFNDRASMATGREVRFPLLDHRVLACGLAMRHEQKFANGLADRKSVV